MSFIDIVILIVFAASVITGLRKGLIRQLGSLLGVVLGILAARLFGSSVAYLYESFLSEETATSAACVYATGIAGNVTVFLIVYLLAAVIARVTRVAIKMALLGPLDRVLGVIIAMFQWFLGLSIVLNVWAAIAPSSSLFHSSKIGSGIALETIMEIAPWLFDTIKAPLFNA